MEALLSGSGCGGGCVLSHKMGAAEELTGAQHKSAKHGFTHWQLLRIARTGKFEGMDPVKARAFFGARWWEVMVAVKGRAQLYKSDGFKELASEYLDENPADEPPEPETVLSFGFRENTAGKHICGASRLRHCLR